MHEIFNPTVGLTDLGKMKAEVYPNPSEGVFTVNGVADNTQVSEFVLWQVNTFQKRQFAIVLLILRTYQLVLICYTLRSVQNYRPIKIRTNK